VSVSSSISSPCFFFFASSFPTTREASTRSMSEEVSDEKKNKKLGFEATMNGFALGGLPVGMVTISAVLSAQQFNFLGFRKALRPSSKVFLAIGPPMVAWSYFSEMSIWKHARGALDEKPVDGELSLKYRALNYFYENTLFAYVSLVLPCYGAVLASELAKPRAQNWSITHALMHTRVIGQGIAVGALVVVFGAREAMKNNGAPFGRISPEDAFVAPPKSK